MIYSDSDFKVIFFYYNYKIIKTHSYDKNNFICKYKNEKEFYLTIVNIYSFYIFKKIKILTVNFYYLY